jgi:hypothetical protein
MHPSVCVCVPSPEINVVSAPYTWDGVITGTRVATMNMTVGVKVGIVSGRGWTPWECICVWKNWYAE